MYNITRVPCPVKDLYRILHGIPGLGSPRRTGQLPIIIDATGLADGKCYLAGNTLGADMLFYKRYFKLLADLTIPTIGQKNI